MTTILLAAIDAYSLDFAPTLLYVGTILIDISMWDALDTKFRNNKK